MNSKTLIYIVKRILLAILTVFVVITATFFIMQIVPGGPFLSEKAKSPQALAALEAKYGLDKPWYIRYFNYLIGAVKFDFGPSIKYEGRTVMGIIKDGMKTSLPLGLYAAAIAIVLGIILGAVAALYRNKIADKIIMVFVTAFVSMPSFIMGVLLLLLFSQKLHWVPANGDTAAGRILPIIALSLSPLANITRLTRSSMLDVLGQDYIRTAKSKGLSGQAVLFKHAIKNSLIPAITYIGPMIAFIVTGSLVIEQIFACPGIGRYFISSIQNRDYPLIMGTTVFLSIIVVFMTLVSDILYKIVDPRIELA